MKADRDSFVILLTFVPVVIGLLLFLLWRSTGSGPFDLPSVDLPNLSLPAITSHDFPAVGGIVDAAQSAGHDAKSLAIGIGVGIVAGLLIAGIILDVTRATRKLSAARSRNIDGPGAGR
ncbi:MAG TPA: hypothetical protein VF221_00285 [Chloroflexota bacterium]